ncbi:antibiotic biosynthesis monooxygenase [Streptacidiphilus sp. PB12-B1b]|uniref:antibiotic biosynthesis monooxygenase family protein n=1 Tax=Streptacidiphilus sp. PB12-B1b TaxID=2705012 RepID=UPI001CDC6A90|nr:antibiotic biosynthesis monooxygenase family protein [Streptacidiphilus sp. PB12-B1b]
MVYQRARDQAELSAIQEAYHLVSKRMEGVPGLLGNELLRSAHDPSGLVVMSRWSDLAAFQAWEQGSEHRADTAPLRPYQDTRMEIPFGVYEVDAAY